LFLRFFLLGFGIIPKMWYLLLFILFDEIKKKKNARRKLMITECDFNKINSLLLFIILKKVKFINN